MVCYLRNGGIFDIQQESGQMKKCIKQLWVSSRYD